MDLTPKGLLVNWVPHLPHLLKLIVQAKLGFSPNHEYQDWLTEVLVQSARPVLQTPAPLLRSQDFFRQDHGVWGAVWISQYTIPAPKGLGRDEVEALSLEAANSSSLPIDIAQALALSIEALATYEDEKTCPIPEFDAAGVEVEWTARRTDAHYWTRPPSKLSNKELYDRMIEDVPQNSDSPVILSAHGGAFCLMDPANHRFSLARLAGMTNSRVVNVRYRLSPQNIFPAALMDMFLAYLALLCPPPGSFHEPIPGYKIILAGDSSGGNLVASLQLLLSTLIATGRSEIRNPWFQGQGANIIRIPNPPTAALSLASPWLDITRSLPSCTLNSRYDFIAPPDPLEPGLMSTSPLFPPDEIWPAKPIRTETYCDAVMCIHPLVSPLNAPKDMLANFPTVYACTGWEGMTDETEVFMRKLHEARIERQEEAGAGDDQSIDLNLTGDVFDGYIGMPHTFSFMEFNQAGRKANRSRANHVNNAIAARLDAESSPPGPYIPAKGRAMWTSSKTMQETCLSFEDLGKISGFSGYKRVHELTDDFVLAKLQEGRIFRVELENRLREHEQLSGKK